MDLNIRKEWKHTCHLWLSLLLRWSHFIVGVAWIGASFYFNWLENHLQPAKPAGGHRG